MLSEVTETVPTLPRDYPEWHRGRREYLVWMIKLDQPLVEERVAAAQRHLSGLLMTPYQRQPHITLFVCGFLVPHRQYSDDFEPEQLRQQAELLENSRIPRFTLKLGGLGSFRSAPFLEVSDPEGGLTRVRRALAPTGPEVAPGNYRPHVTVGLYRGAFPSPVVSGRLAAFVFEPLPIEVHAITAATYQAQELGGLLHYQSEVHCI